MRKRSAVSNAAGATPAKKKPTAVKKTQNTPKRRRNEDPPVELRATQLRPRTTVVNYNMDYKTDSSSSSSSSSNESNEEYDSDHSVVDKNDKNDKDDKDDDRRPMFKLQKKSPVKKTKDDDSDETDEEPTARRTTTKKKKKSKKSKRPRTPAQRPRAATPVPRVAAQRPGRLPRVTPADLAQLPDAVTERFKEELVPMLRKKRIVVKNSMVEELIEELGVDQRIIKAWFKNEKAKMGPKQAKLTRKEEEDKREAAIAEMKQIMLVQHIKYWNNGRTLDFMMRHQVTGHQVDRWQNKIRKDDKMPFFLSGAITSLDKYSPAGLRGTRFIDPKDNVPRIVKGIIPPPGSLPQLRPAAGPLAQPQPPRPATPPTNPPLATGTPSGQLQQGSGAAVGSPGTPPPSMRAPRPPIAPRNLPGPSGTPAGAAPGPSTAVFKAPSMRPSQAPDTPTKIDRKKRECSGVPTPVNEYGSTVDARKRRAESTVRAESMQRDVSVQRDQSVQRDESMVREEAHRRSQSRRVNDTIDMVAGGGSYDSPHQQRTVKLRPPRPRDTIKYIDSEEGMDELQMDLLEARREDMRAINEEVGQVYEQPMESGPSTSRPVVQQPAPPAVQSLRNPVVRTLASPRPTTSAFTSSTSGPVVQQPAPPARQSAAFRIPAVRTLAPARPMAQLHQPTSASSSSTSRPVVQSLSVVKPPAPPASQAQQPSPPQDSTSPSPVPEAPASVPPSASRPLVNGQASSGRRVVPRVLTHSPPSIEVRTSTAVPPRPLQPPAIIRAPVTLAYPGNRQHPTVSNGLVLPEAQARAVSNNPGPSSSGPRQPSADRLPEEPPFMREIRETFKTVKIWNIARQMDFCSRHPIPIEQLRAILVKLRRVHMKDLTESGRFKSADYLQKYGNDTFRSEHWPRMPRRRW